MHHDIRFGTDGWRAVIADTFTFENVRIVAQAIAEYVKSNRPPTTDHGPLLIVGYDNRFLGREFAESVTGECAARAVACVVSDKPVPTPTAAFAIKAFEADGAIMLTASHNPYYYNGIKFIPHYAGPATKEITEKIEANIKETHGSRQSTSDVRLQTADITLQYKEHIKTIVDFGLLRDSGLRVACDPLYGAGMNIMSELLEYSGLDYSMIHDKKDSFFGGGLPDPSEQRLLELKKTVLGERRDIGLGLDGDADRIGIIADDGTYLGANQIVSLLLIHLVKNRKVTGCVVRTVATTHLIDAICEKYGLELIETPVGFKYIGQLMLEKPVIIGGEESGGLSIGGHIPEKDGILADLLVLEMVATEKRTLSQLIEETYNEFGGFLNKRLDIEYEESRKESLFDRIDKKPPGSIAGQEVKAVNRTDGVKFVLSDGSWILIRPSGTEPLVRVYLEASSADRLEAVKKGAEALL